MRIIAGSRRSLKLETVKGMEVRPTTDRIKETLFNMLHQDLPGCRFLDLFAGSGAIGLEALSRGAAECVLIEQNRDALDCIRNNIKTTRFEMEARLLAGDVLRLLPTLRMEPFDYIFMDPPYRQGFEERVLSCLASTTLVGDDTTIIVEAASETPFDFVSMLGYEVVRVKSYGSNQHVFIEKRKQ